MTKIITITLNPAYDIHYEVPQFTMGKENYSTSRIIDAGGKGINISRALKMSGLHSKALIVMGEDNDQDFEAILQQEQIDYLKVPCPGSIRYNVTIHPDVGPETRISQDNFQLAPAKLGEVAAKLTELAEPGAVVAFAGRVPRGINLPTIKSLLQTIKDAGALLVLDSNTFSLEELIKIKPWLIKPNEQEISSLLGRDILDIQEAKKAAVEIHKLGIENVLISLGELGMVYAGADVTCAVKVPQISPLSTIGAGDSTLAGYIYGYVNKMTQLDILKNAAASGTAACLAPGTNPPNPRDIKVIRDQITILN